MATNTTLDRARIISYLNKDFGSFKEDLIKYAQSHHSGVVGDFSESSAFMLLLELNAYIGDVLSYSIDQAFLEMKQRTARQVKNVVDFAKAKGYRPSGKRAATGEVYVAIEVPAVTQTNGAVVPDPLYLPILSKGARFAGPNGSNFESLENVDFSSSLNRDVTGSRYNNDGRPTHFAVRKLSEIVAGETKVDTFSITDFTKFKKLELTNEDVIEVLSVTDSDGNEWHEVDYLAQDMLFDAATNNSSDSAAVPYVMKLVPVPRRFIVDRDPMTNKTTLVFGSGDGVDFDDELVPNPGDLALPLAGKRLFSSYSIDPSNFLKTRSFGLSPYNTTVTVNYRVGGGSETNVPPRMIKSVTNAVLSFGSTSIDAVKKGSVEASIGCLNYKRTTGGGPVETIEEIKANSDAHFAAQQRVVTKEDYASRVLSLPAKFGRPEKVYVNSNSTSRNTVNIHVLTKNANGNFELASDNLKKNIKTYLKKYRMLTDAVNILDSKIVNVRCYFGVVVASKNRSEVLSLCADTLAEELANDKMQIGQPIITSELVSKLHEINGVVSVYDLHFVNAVGTLDGLSYSTVNFDTKANTRDGILYCDDNAIFEIKYPRRDIIGSGK